MNESQQGNNLRVQIAANIYTNRVSENIENLKLDGRFIDILIRKAFVAGAQYAEKTPY